MDKKVEEFISSGIIELYCMGQTNESDTAEVVRLATIHREVRDEILRVTEALTTYAALLTRKPKKDLRGRVLAGIEDNNPSALLPAKLFENAAITYWNQYLKENNIYPAAEYDPFYLAELPSDEKQVTYAVWAKKGASLEETHEGEDEWLFVLHGTCTMTINGKVSHHKAGDLITIPHKHLHKAEATSDEPMILIGQRIAA